MRQDVYDFLVHEASLLDAGDLRAWLELFTPDAIYWVPARFEDPDPTRDVSIVYDDRQRLEERVVRLTSGFAYAQDPPSRTTHLVGNVRVLEESADGLRIGSLVLVTELRRGRQTIYSGSVEHCLVRADGLGPPGYRIRRKQVRLLNSDLPLGNLTFIL